jgi:hypothetical protein
MKTLERERADALLDARPVQRVPEVADTVVERDDLSPVDAFIGMLLGVVVSLPLWAALAVAVILVLR